MPTRQALAISRLKKATCGAIPSMTLHALVALSGSMALPGEAWPPGSLAMIQWCRTHGWPRGPHTWEAVGRWAVSCAHQLRPRGEIPYPGKGGCAANGTPSTAPAHGLALQFGGCEGEDVGKPRQCRSTRAAVFISRHSRPSRLAARSPFQTSLHRAFRTSQQRQPRLSRLARQSPMRKHKPCSKVMCHSCSIGLMLGHRQLLASLIVTRPGLSNKK